MRLINCHTFQLHEFFDSQVPQYAILSHTWGSEEVSFKEMRKGRGKDKEGYRKIEYCCAQAVRDELKWAWVDTCCIDKTSSAELSESINSMFRWYEKAKICYAYLSDVPQELDFKQDNSLFRRSRWFTRGWTLQEMLAPKNVWFYSARWGYIGDKIQLSTTIAEITSIDEAVLKGYRTLRRYSIAQRMSWASDRKTTRVEDIAYCLLGIFDVNLPLIYGEGLKAFFRLQEEIMKGSQDQSLLAWNFTPEELIMKMKSESCLARTPKNFKNAGDIVIFQRQTAVRSYSMTNRGLRITLPMLYRGVSFETAVLRCQRTSKKGWPIGINLVNFGDDQFYRIQEINLDPISMDDVSNALNREIHIGGTSEFAYYRKNLSHDQEFIVKLALDVKLEEVFPKDAWDESHRILRHSRFHKIRTIGWHTAVLFSYGWSTTLFVVVLGNAIGSSWCCILEANRYSSLEESWEGLRSAGKHLRMEMTNGRRTKYEMSKMVGVDAGRCNVKVSIDERKVMGEMYYVTTINVVDIDTEGSVGTVRA